MSGVGVPRNAGNFPGSVYVEEATLTVATAATTATWTSSASYSGIVCRVEIDPSTLTASATIKAYDTSQTLATPNYFLNYTVPNPAVEETVFPLIAATDNAGTAIADQYVQPVVAGKIKIDIASATAADSVTIRVYILG